MVGLLRVSNLATYERFFIKTLAKITPHKIRTFCTNKYTTISTPLHKVLSIVDNFTTAASRKVELQKQAAQTIPFALTCSTKSHRLSSYWQHFTFHLHAKVPSMP
jgi:hypothetical protein